VDNILVSIAKAAAAFNLDNGRIDMMDAEPPGLDGMDAKAALELRGWTVYANVSTQAIHITAKHQ
jgi:hypothetical protein